MIASSAIVTSVSTISLAGASRRAGTSKISSTIATRLKTPVTEHQNQRGLQPVVLRLAGTAGLTISTGITLSNRSQRNPMIHQSTRDDRDEDDRISNKTSLDQNDCQKKKPQSRWGLMPAHPRPELTDMIPIQP